MSVRQPSLHGTPILFADGGASGHERPHSAAAFQLAIRLGATGIEADVLATSDDQPVIVPAARVRRRQRLAIATTTRSSLGDEVIDLDQLAEWAHPTVALSLRPQDQGAASAVAIWTDRAHAAHRVLIRGDDLAALAEVRSTGSQVRLAWSTSFVGSREGPERAIARARTEGIDAIRLRHDEWTGGMVALAHRFRRLAFAWDAQHERIVTAMAHIGVDGISGAYVDRLVDGVGALPDLST